MTKRGGIILSLTLVGLSCAKENSVVPISEAIQKKSEDYIVVLKRPQALSAFTSGIVDVQVSQKVVAQALQTLDAKHKLSPAKKTYSVVLQGGLYHLNPSEVEKLKADPQIAYVEKDQIVRVSAVQNNAPWGLDRIDQQALPLDGNYNHSLPGTVVNAYIIDTGVLTNHQDFGGRAVSGVDTVDGDTNATDCNGHGTHVAGTVGGLIHGVAKNVKLHAVRVLDCAGSGTYSNVIEGIEWVTANHIKPAVANMSLGGPVSKALDDAVNASIQAGVTYVVAAGNDSMNACSSSPSRVAAAVTVGSTDKFDSRSTFSNIGNCLDLFAPGTDITSAWHTSVNSTRTLSGTSMASPHVAGVAALYLAQNPQATPAQVRDALVAGAVVGKISNPGSGSPNVLLNAGFLPSGGDEPDDEEDSEPDDSKLENGVAKGPLAGEEGALAFYSIDVPAGVRQIRFEITGGSGDADLYVKKGVLPSQTIYDCRPYKWGNVESCTFSQPARGTWHVMIRAYDHYSGVSLKVTY